MCVSVDLDDNGYICDYELHELLKDSGHALPGYMVREIIQKLDRNHDNKISFEEFLSVRNAVFVVVCCVEPDTFSPSL